MRNSFVLSVIVSVFFSSCTSYYYALLSSGSSQTEKGDEGEFILKDKDVVVSYSFNGENAPIEIEIFNKTDHEFNVDWYKSALILNDVATFYKEDPVLNQISSSFAENDNNISYRLNLIPPKSKIRFTPLELADFSFDLIPDKEYYREK